MLSIMISSSAVIIRPSVCLNDASRLARNFSIDKSVSSYGAISGKSRILLKIEPILTRPVVSILPILPIPIRLLTIKPPVPAWHLRSPASSEDVICTPLPRRLHSSVFMRLATTLPLSECKTTFKARSFESPELTPTMLPVV